MLLIRVVLKIRVEKFQLQSRKMVPMVEKTPHVKLFPNRTTFTAAPTTLNFYPYFYPCSEIQVRC